MGTQADPRPRTAADRLTRGELRRARTRVLVVEDEPELRECLIDGLRGAGFEVIGAANGEEALLCVPTPEVVIVDLSMPVLDGREYLRALRTRGERPNVILVSGQEELPQVAREEEVPWSFAKPVELRRVINAVNSLMAAQPTSA